MLGKIWSDSHSYSLLVGTQNGIAIWKRIWPILLYDSVTVLQNIYPAELKTYVHAMNCTGMFIAALFIINTTGEKTKMSFTGWWINKLRSIQAMEYYLVLKWNELSSHEKTGENLKCILRSERSQPARATFCMISTVWRWKKQNYGDGKKISGF